MASLNIAIANTNTDIEIEEIAQFFQERIRDFNFSVAEYGLGKKAAFDILGETVTLSTITDLQSIASALKLAWDFYISPIRQSNPTAGLYVNFKDGKGSDVSFMLDTPQDSEVIIRKLKTNSTGVLIDELRLKPR